LQAMGPRTDLLHQPRPGRMGLRNG
jgi:hypothetical protein